MKTEKKNRKYEGENEIIKKKTFPQLLKQN